MLETILIELQSNRKRSLYEIDSAKSIQKLSDVLLNKQIN